MERQRDFGLDLVRAAAAVFVLSVHFFLNNGFYSAPLQGAEMAAGAVLRMAFMTCVPLFMTLTGYLRIGRKWSRDYYRGLLPVVLTYLLASAACLAFRMGVQGEQFSALGVIRQFLGFAAAPYSWYVEMYIGLFLLAPFMNAAWHGLEARGRNALVLTLVVMTALPLLVNLYAQLLPRWWTGIYPLTYYVVGAWLREHPVTVKRRWLALGWLGLSAAGGLAQYVGQGLLRPGEPLLVGGFNYFGSFLTLAETVCLFCCLRQFDGSKAPAPVRWCVGRVARLSLPLYLMSYITDQLIYPPLLAAFPDAGGSLPWLPVMAAVSLVCSGLMAQVLDWAVRGLMKLVPKGKQKQNQTANGSMP